MTPPPHSSAFRLRDYRPEDAPLLSSLFYDSVHRVNSRDYSPDQIAAWAPEQIDQGKWAARFQDKIAVVAKSDSTVVGFADISTDGHLDRLFVSAEHQRRGVASMLLDELVRRAGKLSIDCITTEASITAKPFFLARGFEVLKEQSVECRGQWLTNYRMQRLLE
ncbi:putative N-acetyltransferase YafP [Novipirellula aureliae]|uniref:Putative N-acetyltransferase YafP n=1 Tax=Novipirellula aureliae TaxID=2527966 RepID=A0A5C6DR63_9BACT|nr:GNAT family N-acetyltransferase [Novipirellula aureliae]TWU38705.1 putative N-acetyltransferase YafP [Novipirellula aureliae]